jgi:uncharacterized protein (DUF169 family)
MSAALTPATKELTPEVAAHALETLLRLPWPPVAVRFVRAGEEPPRGLLKRSKHLTFCQLLAIAATGGFPLLVGRDNMTCPNARVAFGFADLERDAALRGEIVRTHTGKYARDPEHAEALVMAKPRVAPGSVAAVALAPLARASFTPDAVMMVASPYQAYFAIGGWLYETGGASVPFEVGTNSLICAFGAVRAGVEGRMSLVPSCSGGRTFAGFQTTDMLLSVPWPMLAPMVRGVRARAREHPYPGMIAMPAPAPLPPKHVLQPDEAS